MKISEIKEKRIIHRPTRNFDKLGNRIYQEFEYDFNFKTRTDENYFVRLLAKIIDLVPIKEEILIGKNAMEFITLRRQIMKR